jgi:hypothetical protein
LIHSENPDPVTEITRVPEDLQGAPKNETEETLLHLRPGETASRISCGLVAAQFLTEAALFAEHAQFNPSPESPLAKALPQTPT